MSVGTCFGGVFACGEKKVNNCKLFNIPTISDQVRVRVTCHCQRLVYLFRGCCRDGDIVNTNPGRWSSIVGAVALVGAVCHWMILVGGFLGDSAFSI